MRLFVQSVGLILILLDVPIATFLIRQMMDKCSWTDWTDYFMYGACIMYVTGIAALGWALFIGAIH